MNGTMPLWLCQRIIILFLNLKGNSISFKQHVYIYRSLEVQLHMLESGTKPIVAPEEAACHLRNVLC